MRSQNRRLTAPKTVRPLEDVRFQFIQCALQSVSLVDKFPAAWEASAREKLRACNRSEVGQGALPGAAGLAHSGGVRQGHVVHWHGMALSCTHQSSLLQKCTLARAAMSLAP